MKGCINGIIRDLTIEEEEALKEHTIKPQTTIENRIEALELALVDLAIKQAEVLSNE